MPPPIPRDQRQNLSVEMQTITEKGETSPQNVQRYMTWEEIIAGSDSSEEEDAAAAAQQSTADEDAKDGENSRENSKNGEN